MGEGNSKLQFDTSETLIAKVNSFLDGITSFNVQNAQVLEDYIERMTQQGFRNPFKPVIITTEGIDISADTKNDMKKQIKIMKDLYMLKRNTLRRAKVALAAHKLALHFEKTGYLQEISGLLPFDGGYIKLIASFDLFSYDAYLMLMEFLGTSGASDYSVVIKLKRKEGDSEVIEHFKLINPNNISERIKAIYGNSAEILGTRFISPRSRLIKGSEYRIALASALIKWAAIQHPEKSYPKNKDLEKYNELLQKHGVSKYYRIDLAEGYEELKDKLVESKLGFYYHDNEFILNEELARQIDATRIASAKNIFTTAKTLLQQNLLEYLIANTEFNFLPNFAVASIETYGSIFKEFNFKNVKLDLSQAIKEFFDLKKYGILETRLLLASLCAKYGIEINLCAELFGVSKQNISKGIVAVKNLDIDKLREFHEDKKTEQ